MDVNMKIKEYDDIYIEIDKIVFVEVYKYMNNIT